MLNDLTYMDSTLREQGVLFDYELDFDTAQEKDFEIRTPDFSMNIGDYFFINGTEYGGVIDKFQSDTSSNEVIYRGRNFRGILESLVVQGQPIASGTIDEEINRRLAECGVDNLYICDAPEDVEGINIDVSDYQYRYRDSYLYDGIIDLANYIKFNVLFEYRQSDHKVHIIPTFVTDHSEYLTYCKDNSVDFVVAITGGNINHVIVNSQDEDGRDYRIHIFADGDYGIQPYVVDSNSIYNPIEQTWSYPEAVENVEDLPDPTPYPKTDEDYILDESKKILSGLNENVYVLDYDSNEVVYNYILTEEEPTNNNSELGAWSRSYVWHYAQLVKMLNIEEDVEAISQSTFTTENQYYLEQLAIPSSVTEISSDAFSKLESLRTIYCAFAEGAVSGAPWGANEDQVSIYYNYPVEFEEEDVFSYEAVQPENGTEFILQNSKPADWETNYGNYYIRTGGSYGSQDENDYSTVSGENKVQSKTKIATSTIKDWNSTYGLYYTMSWKGDHWDYANVQGRTKTSYKKHTKKPSDWNKNFSKYWFKKNVYKDKWVKGEKKQVKTGWKWAHVEKKKTVIKVKTGAKYDHDVKKNGKIVHKKGDPKYSKTTKRTVPTWKKNKYYTQTTIEYPPKPKPKYVYKIQFSSEAPAWQANYYYTKRDILKAPKWKENTYFYRVEDHYAKMVEEAIGVILDNIVSDSQEISLSEAIVNIGDTVGGIDDITGIEISQPVNNIVIKAQNGILKEVNYSIGGDIDGYNYG